MTQATTDIGLCNVREFGAVFVPPETNKQERNSRVKNATFFAIPWFEVYHSKLHFGGSTDTKMVKWNSQMSVNTTIEITELMFYSGAFLMK